MNYTKSYLRGNQLPDVAVQYSKLYRVERAGRCFRSFCTILNIEAPIKIAMAQAMEDFNFYSEATKRKGLPTDPTTRAHVEHVLQHGYVIIPNCFTAAQAREARKEIERLLGASPLGGRNPFEGLNTNRIYSLLNKTRVFDKFAMLPQVLALNDYFLDPGYLLTAFHTISINRKCSLYSPGAGRKGQYPFADRAVSSRALYMA